MPKVTVLMSAYNTAKYIKSAIDSILSQSFRDFELLIIYNPSQDNTLEIIKSYNDNRIVLIENESLLELVDSLNKGLLLAKGEYIARMDADDISRANRLIYEVEKLDNNLDIGMVCSDIDVIDNADNIINSPIEVPESEEIYYTLNFRNCISHGTVMLRKALIAGFDGYDKKCYAIEDYDLWYRISKVFIIKRIEKPLYCWRKHDESISHVHATRQRDAVYGVFKNNAINLLGVTIDDMQARLIWDNACNTQLVSRDSYSRMELIAIAELINKLNVAITKVTPKHLNKNYVAQAGNEKYIRYLIVMSKRIGVLKTLQLISDINEDNTIKKEIVVKLAKNVIKSKIK